MKCCVKLDKLVGHVKYTEIDLPINGLVIVLSASTHAQPIRVN